MTALIVALIAAPGLVFEGAARRLDSEQRVSTFVEVQRILLAGILSTLCAVAIVRLALAILGADAVDVGAWIRDGSKYSASHVTRISVTAVVVLLVACALVLVAARRLYGPQDVKAQARPALWEAILAGGPERETIVRRADGTLLAGRITDIDDPSRGGVTHVALVGPLSMRHKDGSEAAGPTGGWERVVLRLDAIDEIWLTQGGDAGGY